MDKTQIMTGRWGLDTLPEWAEVTLSLGYLKCVWKWLIFIRNQKTVKKGNTEAWGYVNNRDEVERNYCGRIDFTGQAFHSILEKSHFLCQHLYIISHLEFISKPVLNNWCINGCGCPGKHRWVVAPYTMERYEPGGWMTQRVCGIFTPWEETWQFLWTINAECDSSRFFKA